MPRLENWALISTSSPYTPPEAIKLSLHGNVFNHSKFNDGDEVTTSTIVGLRDELILTYSGSKYELGEPHPDYEKKYPNAKQRVFDSMNRPNSSIINRTLINEKVG